MGFDPIRPFSHARGRVPIARVAQMAIWGVKAGLSRKTDGAHQLQEKDGRTGGCGRALDGRSGRARGTSQVVSATLGWFHEARHLECFDFILSVQQGRRKDTYCLRTREGTAMPA